MQKVSGDFVKNIYLIAQAKPDSDLSLGKTGILQACMLKEQLRKKDFGKVCAAGQKSAVQTAAFLSDEVEILPEQLMMGNFKNTFCSLVNDFAESSEGNIAVVLPQGIIEAFASGAGNLNSQDSKKPDFDFCDYICMRYDGKHCVPDSKIPLKRELSPKQCLEFLDAVKLPDRIVRHVKAVRDQAVKIAGALNEKGMELDAALIENAALLHDICRQEQNHAAAGAALMDELGFKREAEIIRQHHDLKSGEINEAAVVYLADKLVKEDKPVTLEERFSFSAAKCRDEEAAAAHARRFAQAKDIYDKVQHITGLSMPI